MPFDPDAYISGGTKTEEKKSTDFDPNAYISGTSAAAPSVDSNEIPVDQSAGAFGMAAPAVTGAAYASPTGINPSAVKQGLRPMMDIVPKTMSQYMAPGGVLKGGLDLLGLGTVGVPPVASFEAMKGLAQTPEAISKTASEVGKITSQSPLTTSAVSGAQYPSSVPAYREIQRAVGPEAAAKMSEAYAKGGNNAVLKYLESAPEVKGLMGSEDFAKLYETYKGAVPGKLAQVGKVLGPVARGAARVAGPAGLAYDIYEAYPYYEQANVPERLASGEIRQTMNQARRAPLNAPTPAPLSQQEAQNLYQSGDQRLIDIYKNDAALKDLIRRKAAEKVLGPVVPQ